MKKSAITLTLSLLSLTFLTATAQASTRIKFAQGSYCGSYSGNFSNGREFILGLGRGQTFTSRNIGDGTQYDVYVIGPTGRVDGDKVNEAQISYPIPVSGNYRVYLESSTPSSSVEFCAY